MPESGKYFHASVTIGDTAALLNTATPPLIFIDVDFQCQTHPVDVGDVNAQDLELAVGDVLSYRSARGIDLREIFFKNHTAGSNGVIVVAGVLK